MIDSTVTLSPAARRDLDNIVDWMRDENGSETSSRFADAIDTTFARLSGQPLVAPSIQTRDIRLTNVRKWPVFGFTKILIFFEPRPNGMFVLRVLHASSDWWSLFGLIDQKS